MRRLQITGEGNIRRSLLCPEGKSREGTRERLGDLGAEILEKRTDCGTKPNLPPALEHKLLGDLPGKLASPEMAVARGLLVDGPFQVQVPAVRGGKSHF